MVCSSAPFLLTLLGTYYPGEAYLQTRFFRQTQRELRVHTVREFAGICLEVDPTKSSINPPLLVQSHHTHTHGVYLHMHTYTCTHNEHPHMYTPTHVHVFLFVFVFMFSACQELVLLTTMVFIYYLFPSLNFITLYFSHSPPLTTHLKIVRPIFFLTLWFHSLFISLSWFKSIIFTEL